MLVVNANPSGSFAALGIYGINDLSNVSCICMYMYINFSAANFIFSPKTPVTLLITKKDKMDYSTIIESMDNLFFSFLWLISKLCGYIFCSQKYSRDIACSSNATILEIENSLVYGATTAPLFPSSRASGIDAIEME